MRLESNCSIVGFSKLRGGVTSLVCSDRSGPNVYGGVYQSQNSPGKGEEHNGTTKQNGGKQLTTAQNIPEHSTSLNNLNVTQAANPALYVDAAIQLGARYVKSQKTVTT